MLFSPYQGQPIQDLITCSGSVNGGFDHGFNFPNHGLIVSNAFERNFVSMHDGLEIHDSDL